MDPVKPDFPVSKSADQDFFFIFLASLQPAQLTALEKYFISLNEEIKRQYRAPLVENKKQAQAFALRHLVLASIDLPLQEKLIKIRKEKSEPHSKLPESFHEWQNQLLFHNAPLFEEEWGKLVPIISRLIRNLRLPAIEVNNMGEGNCLFYAYGISLIHYLKNENQEEITHSILEKIPALSRENKETLFSIIHNESTITPKEYEQIQLILGPKLRRLAAERLKQEFKENPKDSNLFSVACYCAQQLLEPTAPNPLFTEAEFYKLPKLKEDFTRYITMASQDGLISHEEQLKILIIDYFLKDECKQLNVYLEHLNTDRQWGTEEQIHSLHRAITNEHMLGEEGSRRLVSDHSIHFDITQAPLTTLPTANGIFLRNIDNRHWTSLIGQILPSGPAAHSLFSENFNQETLQSSASPTPALPATLTPKALGQKAPLFSLLSKHEYDRERNRFAAKKSIPTKATVPHDTHSQQKPSIGFEVEMDGTRLPPEVRYLIELTNKDKLKRLMEPDDYLKKYDMNPDQAPSMYDVQIMRVLLKSDDLCTSCQEKDYINCEKNCSPLFDIALDSSTEYGKYSLYLPEFRTDPLNLLTPAQEIKKKISYFSSMINHFVAHHQSNEKKSLSSWSEEFDLQQSKQGDLQCLFDIESGLEPKEGYQAKMVFNETGSSFDPIFAVHVNLNVPLELLFSFQMFQLFEIRNNYPLLESNQKKEWPSSNPPMDYIDFLETLTIENEANVNHFLNKAKQTYSGDCSLTRVAGVIRTLSFIYRLTQFLYNEEVFKQYFPQNIFIDDCNKDYFVAGLPKFNLTTLAKEHLNTNEQDFLKYILSTPSLSNQLTYLFKTPYFYGLPEISIGEEGELCTNIKMSVDNYIFETLRKPLSPLGTTQEIKCFIQKTIDDALVVEFRSPKALGYQAKDIEQMLMTYVDNAHLFATTKYQELNPNLATRLMQQKALKYFGLNQNFSEENFSPLLIEKLSQNPNADRLQNHLKIIEDLIEKTTLNLIDENDYSSDDESDLSLISEHQETHSFFKDDDLQLSHEYLKAPLSPMVERGLSHKDLFEDSDSLFKYQSTGMHYENYPPTKSPMDISFTEDNYFKKPETDVDFSFYAKEKSSSFLFWPKKDLEEDTLSTFEKLEEIAPLGMEPEIDADAISEAFDSELIGDIQKSKDRLEDFSLPVGYYYVPENKLFVANNLSAAGASQEDRLRWVVTATEKSTNPQSLFAPKTTSRFNLALETWENLFTAILHEGPKESKKIIAKYFFNVLDRKNDALYLALISTHEKDYLIDFISKCCSVYHNSIPFHEEAGDDVIVNQHLFELYIRDLIASIESTCPIQLNVGLPTHHAKTDAPSGFCFINKLAVLAMFHQQQSQTPLDSGNLTIRHIFIGLDVNQDDGLHQVLNEMTLNYHHIDTFDEEKFPGNDLEMIAESRNNPLKFGSKRRRVLEPPVYQQNEQRVGYQITPLKKHYSSNPVSAFQTHYTAEAQVYSALALNSYQRSKADTLHPAMVHIFTLLKREIEHHNHLVIYIPLGFDSHIEDKTFDAKQDSVATKKGKRFTSNDFITFYKTLLSMYHTHREKIKAIYISLEGGYEQKILSRELELLIKELDSLNHSCYQALNNQIITNIKNEQWALAISQLQVTLNNQSINSTEKYYLLSQLLFASVNSGQASKAQLIYDEMLQLLKDIQPNDVLLITGKHKIESVAPLRLSLKRNLESSLYRNRRNYFSALKDMTKILLNNNLYTEENAKKIKLIFPSIEKCVCSILINIANFEGLTQIIFDQVISLLVPSTNSTLYGYSDLATLNKILNLFEEPQDGLALLTKSVNPSINMDLVFILHYLMINKKTTDSHSFVRVTKIINEFDTTLIPAFQYLHSNKLKLLPEHIDFLIEDPAHAYEHAIKIVDEKSLAVRNLTACQQIYFQKVKGASPDISAAKIESLYSQYAKASVATYVDDLRLMRAESGNDFDQFINKIFALTKFTLERTTTPEPAAPFFTIRELNEPEIYLNTKELREGFFEAHNNINLQLFYKAHFQSPVLHRKAYMYFISGLIHDKRNNPLSATKNLLLALRCKLPEEDKKEALTTLIKNAFLYFHQFEVHLSQSTSNPSR